MLNASELNAVMNSAVGDGVLLGLVLDANGTTIVSVFSKEDPARAEADSAAIIAATANVWRVYAGSDLAVNKMTLEAESDALEQVLIDFGERKLCAMSVADTAVLCLVSCDPAMQIGLLKLKTAALQQRVDLLLRPVMMMQ